MGLLLIFLCSVLLYPIETIAKCSALLVDLILLEREPLSSSVSQDYYYILPHTPFRSATWTAAQTKIVSPTLFCDANPSVVYQVRNKVVQYL